MVFCQNCGLRPSSYVIEVSSNGEKKSVCLCESCAVKMGLIENRENKAAMLNNKPMGFCCPTCGTTEENFKSTGFVGCKDCYLAFSSSAKVVENWQGASRHVGKVSASPVSVEKKLEILMARFKDAIERNDLKEAALLKKEIQILGAKSAKK